jgi:hypothetical protein
MLTTSRPRGRRAESISQQERDVHHWLGRLAMCLAIASHDLPDGMKNHARKTLDEFIASPASSGTLAEIVRTEVKR